MELKDKVLETIKNMCECGGLASKPRIYAIARFLHVDKSDVINAVDELVAEGIVEYRSDVPSESHICITMVKKYSVSKKRAKMRKLAEEFHSILEKANGCPFETYNKILDEGYRGEDMRIMFRLLYRWVEWQKLSGYGGRIYYNYFKLLEEYA